MEYFANNIYLLPPVDNAYNMALEIPGWGDERVLSAICEHTFPYLFIDKYYHFLCNNLLGICLLECHKFTTRFTDSIEFSFKFLFLLGNKS